MSRPTAVAKMVASLDVISGGRLIFGIGVGGEFPGEFAASGVPVNERGARTNEALTVLRRLWHGGAAEHVGRFFRIGPVRLTPPPAQAGGPPIWIGGRADAALRRTARYGDGYVGYLLTPDGFRERIARMETQAAEMGQGARPITRALMTFAVVDDNRDAALRTAGAALSKMYARPMEGVAARYCIAGTPADCRDAVTRYAEVGVEHLILTPLAGRENTLQQIQALAGALSLSAISK